MLNINKKYFQSFALLFCTIIIFSCTKVATDKNESASSVTIVESSHSWDGTLLPNYPKGTPKITLLKITIPPKTKLELHKHPVINVGVLTKGELTVVKENDGKTLTLHPGDGIVELVNQYHYGINNKDTPAEILVFYAGNQDTKLVDFKE